MVNGVAFEDFFVRLSTGVTNLGVPGLPKDVHFSISHYPNADINFHVTRNTNDPAKKPKLVIFKISRANTIFSLQVVGQNLFDLLYEQVHINLHQAKFVPAQNLNWMKRGLKNVLIRASKVKNKKRRIATEFPQELLNFSQDRSVRWRLLHSIINLQSYRSNHCAVGYIISKQFTGSAIMINGCCYRQKAISLYDFAQIFAERELVDSIIFKTLLAIKRVSRAQNSTELEYYNQPLELSMF